MEKIDVQNFKKYLHNDPSNATLARVGHVNAVIDELNNLAPEVAITAGANIAVTGEGTPANPFVITGSAGGGGYKDLGDSSQTTNVDWSQAATQELNLDNNPTLTFANAEAGDSLSLLLKSTGFTQKSVNWPNDVLWNRGLTPSISTLVQNGKIDPTFLSGTGLTSQNMGSGSADASFPTGICYTLSTGKILIWNNSQSAVKYNNVYLPGSDSMNGNRDLIRLNSDGTLDNTWTTNFWASFQEGITCIYELSDGRILVGGDFNNGTNPNFYGNGALQLLSADGLRDNTFMPIFAGGGMFSAVKSIVQQSTGKVIVGGDFSTVDGQVHREIARFNTDMTLDATFITEIGDYMSYNDVTAVALASDDSIYVGGYFTNTPINNSGSYSYLVKLDMDGNIAPFNYAAGPLNGSIYTMVVDNTGSIVIGGAFDNYNNTTIGYGIARILPTGALDTSFNTGSGANAAIQDILVLPNNKLIVLSSYASYYNNSQVSRIFALDTAGAIDTEIVIPSTGLSGQGAYSSYGLTLQTTGDILVTGAFNAYGGVSANAIVSINVSTTTEVYTEIDFKHNGVNYIGSFK